MPQKETRKPLSATQVKHLTESQETLNKARTALAEAEKNARQILTLIFDAVGLPEDAVVRFDEATNELVVAEDAEEPAGASTK